MDNGVSMTAIGAARMRAAHVLLDDKPTVFNDSLAMRFSGFEDENQFRQDAEKMLQLTTQHVGAETARQFVGCIRASVAVRSRYSEDALREAITKRSVNRYVMLGSGLDTFAWRQPDWAKGAQLFEVDHPASQKWKIERMKELGFKKPDNLTFIPIDFESQTLTEGLRAGGLPMDKPAFFSWLGVTLYLQRETVLNTLKQIAALGPDTEISFTFRVPPETLSEQDRMFGEMVKAGAASSNEPLLSAFDPQELAERVKELGYGHVKYTGHEELNRTYFANRKDGLRCHGLSHLMLARV